MKHIPDRLMLAAAAWMAVGCVGVGNVRTDGVPLAVESARAEATVYLFLSPDCPITNGYAPEIARIYDRYGSAGFDFVLVYPDVHLEPGAGRRHTEAYGMTGPKVVERDLKLAQRVGATITPEAAVVSPDGRVLYRGRINGRYPDIGIRLPTVKRHDLREALDAVLKGRQVEVKRTKAVGCFIETAGGD